MFSDRPLDHEQFRGGVPNHITTTSNEQAKARNIQFSAGKLIVQDQPGLDSEIVSQDKDKTNTNFQGTCIK